MSRGKSEMAEFFQEKRTVKVEQLLGRINRSIAENGGPINSKRGHIQSFNDSKQMKNTLSKSVDNQTKMSRNGQKKNVTIVLETSPDVIPTSGNASPSADQEPDLFIKSNFADQKK